MDGVGWRLGLAVGMGFAAFEVAALAFGPTPPGAAAIGWILTSDVLVALAISALVGLWRPGGDELAEAEARAGASAGGTALALLAAYVAPGIALLASEGRGGALVLVVAPLGVAALAWLGARRIARWGRADAVLTVSVGVVALVASVAPFAPGPADPSGARPSVLVVTVDGLRADAVPAELAALTAGGVTFADAVTPIAEPRAANASVLTGLHPLRDGVVEADDRLSRAWPTLFEVLQAHGWATAAFGSTRAVGPGSGLDQGFDRVDHGWSGAEDSAVGRIAAGVARRLFDRQGVGGLSARSDRRTAEAFARWVAQRRGPWAAWVQLADLHRQELGAVATPTTAEAARILADAVPDGALVVVVGTHGELRGAHGAAPHVGLYDELVHVPLALRLPGDPPSRTTVEAQVRTLDVAATVWDVLDVDPDTETEGVSLAGYFRGNRTAPMSCTLLGKDADGSWLVGIRADRVKVVSRADGAESLFLLAEDPGEATDRAADQPGALAQVRALLASDRAALGRRD